MTPADLVAKWRAEFYDLEDDTYGDEALFRCADELEAALLVQAGLDRYHLELGQKLVNEAFEPL